ncbi:hypothetical protein JCM33374_g2024 [Metschnikowia sp. JCM 33374]|nr:hypothetical protein JCM33374_g2024 [Metschnikowia sp. JCM 33374]
MSNLANNDDSIGHDEGFVNYNAGPSDITRYGPVVEKNFLMGLPQPTTSKPTFAIVSGPLIRNKPLNELKRDVLLKAFVAANDDDMFAKYFPKSRVHSRWFRMGNRVIVSAVYKNVPELLDEVHKNHHGAGESGNNIVLLIDSVENIK